MHTLSNDMVRAIGWTLIHSLWQGLVLAVVAGVLILCTRKAKPALRYNIFTLLFFMLVGSAAVTFLYELNKAGAAPVQQTAVAGINTPLPAAVAMQPLPAVSQPAAPGFPEKFVAYFNEHAPLLVMAWFIIFAARLLWLFGGLVSMQRIRHYKTSAPDVVLVNSLQQLAARLQLCKHIQLLESAMVKVPTVLGMLKPVILLPAGLMAQLPPDQVEAVLLHELAHIRRRDFMVNLIQHFAETIFFFNPALLWLSARIREEREHCCDDMAINATQSKIGYVQALVTFQELHLSAGVKYAMAFPGKKKQLLHRVKRILGQHNSMLNMAEKSFLLICCSFIGLLGVVFAYPGKVKAPVEKTSATPAAAVAGNNNTLQQEGAAHTGMDTVYNVPAINKEWDRYKNLAPKEVTEGTTLQFEEQRNGLPYMIYLFKRAQVLYQAEIDAADKIMLLKVNGQTVYRQGDDPEQLARYSPALQTLAADYKLPYQVNYQPYQAAYQPYQAAYQPYLPQEDTVPVLHKANTTYSGTIKTTFNNQEYTISVEDNRTSGLMIDGLPVLGDELKAKYGDVSAIFRQMEAEDAELDRDRQEIQRQRQELERQKAEVANDRATQPRNMNRDALKLQGQLSAGTPLSPVVALSPAVALSPVVAPGPKVAMSPSVAQTASVAHSPAVALSASPAASPSTVLSVGAPMASPAPLTSPTPQQPVAPKKGLAEQLLDQLLAEGLIKQQNKVSFRLNSKKFIINDVKQSDAITRRYQQKYIKGKNDTISFSRSGGTTTASVYIDN